MRFVAISALFALAACATTPASTPPATQSVAATPAPTARNWASDVFAAAGTPRAASRQEVERMFGLPDIARQEGSGAMLTYRLQSCALVLMFTADARNELRLAEANAGPRRAGEPAPSLDQCASEASARAPRR